MKIETIEFSSSDKNTPAVRKLLTLSAHDDLIAMKKDQLPCVCVVRASSLDAFRPYKEIIEDRGVKHSRVDLSRIMLGKNRIPIVDGSSFESSPQFGRSVRTLLKNALKEKERNLYIIGIGDGLFDELAKSAKEAHSLGQSDYQFSATGDATDSCAFPGSIMKLMTKEDTSKLKETFIGQSKEAEFVRRLILRAAEVENSVLIIGDSGTGKEIVAQQIHKLSRRMGKFRPVNCSAFPGDLLEAELFGHKKGAFSGAVEDKKGLWEEATNGTLFLDEIGDLSLNHQAKILRALQEKKIRRIGETNEIKVNARIIAATNRDLSAMVESDEFREDLYYRLRDFYIPTPPLRDHPSDVPLLASFLWASITKGARPPLTHDIMALLQEYPWPGNVRELKTVLSQLNGMFLREEMLSVEHVTEIFKMNGQMWGKGKKDRTKPAHEKPCIKMECLRHLRRVFETVMATTKALKSLIEGKTDEASVAAVGRRIEELDLLCLYPLRFHKEEVYVQVNSMRSKVFYLYNLLSGERSSSTLEYWDKSVQAEVRQTTSILSQEIEEINEVKGW